MRSLYRLIALATMLVAFSRLSAQVVSGTVRDKSGPLPGVIVQDMTTKAGTASDADGKYSLNVGVGKTTIEFQYAGYVKQVRTVTLAAGQTLPLNITLEEDEKVLDEVVVVGYGVQRKRDVTGSITQIDGKEMTKVPVPSFEAALQGKGSGIQVSQGSGLAGSGSLVRIRGVASISAGGDPLYVVDGLPITQNQFLRGNGGAMNANPLTFLNPNDIESVEVLKDAAATGIYGSRGANGVILITTKRGKQKGFSATFNTRIGTSSAASKPNMMNTDQYLAIRQEAWENDGGTGYVFLPGLSNSSDPAAVREAAYKNAQKTSTNWFDELTGVGIKQSYNVGLNYVGNKFKSYTSLGVDDNGSYIVGNSFKRNSLRTNLDWQPTKKILITTGLSFTNTINKRVDAAWSGGIGEAMSTALPYFPVYKDNGDFFMWNGGYSNPVNYREKRKWVNNDHRVLANLSAMYTLNDNFFIKGTAAVDYMDMNEMKYLPKGLNIGQTQDYAERNPTWVTNYNANLTANYIKTVAEGHRLNVLVGSELQDQRTQYYSSIAYPGLTALPTSDAVQSSTVTPIYNGEAKNRATFVSFFARANYSIKDKYFLQLVARADGSSKFGVNKRFGTFPSVSGGWVISEERFLKGNKTLNFLKLRAGLGVTGNSDIPTNAQYETWSVSTFGYGGTPYRYQAKLGNPNLQWETSKIFDAALEFGLWKDRLTGTIGVYRKMSTNVLLQYNVQSSTGFSDAWSNAGKIKNQGIELTLHSNNIGSKHKLQWTTDLNISRNQNEVISIGSFTPDALSGGTNDSRVQIGKPVGSFYLVQYAGVDPATGKPMYYDLNGNKTYDYNLQNRQYAGAGLPKAYGGITNNFSYGRWSVNIFMTYSLGAKIFDSSAKRQLGVVTDWNMRTDLLDRWTQPGDESNHPRLTLNETNYGLTTGNPWWNTTLFIYKADYLRMKNIAITYNFKMAGKGLVKSLAVTGSVSNLFVITNFPGLDPELVRDFENAQDRNLSPNVTYLTPPQERSFNLTLNASF